MYPARPHDGDGPGARAGGPGPADVGQLRRLGAAEAALTAGHRVDADEAERRLEEAAYFRQVVENIGIMILRAEGLEPDPVRSRELMQQWFDLGSVQESLEEIRARWGT